MSNVYCGYSKSNYKRYPIKRCKQCSHSVRLHHTKINNRNAKRDGYCIAFGCHCSIPLEDLI